MKRVGWGIWEVDTVIGKDHQGALLTIVERKSKLTLIALLPNKTAEQANMAMCDQLMPLANYVHTITTDNGKEFAYHKKTASALNAQCFFAKSYQSCQRGLNENTNGLIRQYIPKKFDFALLDDKMVLEIQNRINFRPRKTLGFKNTN